MAEPLHQNCVVCQAVARAGELPPGEETIILLGILLDGETELEEDVRQELCFVHRRRVEDVARHLGGAA